MCYNKKYILLSIILISFLFNQSYFNRILGSKIISGDASSLATGNTYLTTEQTSNLVFSNPARLSLLNNNIVLDFQFNYHTLNERKSMMMIRIRLRGNRVLISLRISFEASKICLDWPAKAICTGFSPLKIIGTISLFFTLFHKVLFLGEDF